MTEPAPAVRLTNARPAPAPTTTSTDERRAGSSGDAPSADERLFPEEGSAEGCASGECLPEEAPAPVAAQAPARTGRDNPAQSSGERWRAAVEAVKATSPRHGAALAHGRLLWLRPGEVGLAYLPTAGFHRGMVSGTTGRPLVEKVLSEHFGRPTLVVVQEATAESAASAPLSIAEQDTQARTAYTQSTEGKVRSHPSVRAVLKVLGGEIEHIQVLEPERPPAGPALESPDESA